MKNFDFERLMEWQKAKVGRTFDIKVGEPSYHSSFKVWVYDYNMQTGQHIDSVDEINLAAVKEEEERKQLEYLKQKFEVV